MRLETRCKRGSGSLSSNKSHESQSRVTSHKACTRVHAAGSNDNGREKEKNRDIGVVRNSGRVRRCAVCGAERGVVAGAAARTGASSRATGFCQRLVVNTAPRAPSRFVGLFDSFPSRAPPSPSLLRLQDVTPAPVVSEPDVTPAATVPTRANDDDILPSTPTETKPVSESPGQDLPHSRRGGTRYAAPRSALWAARRIQEDKPESAIAILRNWTHTKRLQ